MVEVAGDPAAGCMPSQASADDTAGYDPIMIDIPVRKGVIVTGRIVDVSTGEPVPGYALASVLMDNPLAKNYPEFGASAWLNMHRSENDGTFRVVTIPGPVILMHVPNTAAELAKFKRAAPDPR